MRCPAALDLTQGITCTQPRTSSPSRQRLCSYAPLYPLPCKPSHLASWRRLRTSGYWRSSRPSTPRRKLAGKAGKEQQQQLRRDGTSYFSLGCKALELSASGSRLTYSPLPGSGGDLTVL